MKLYVDKVRLIEGAYRGFSFPSVTATLEVQPSLEGVCIAIADAPIIVEIPTINEQLSCDVLNSNDGPNLLKAAISVAQEVLSYFDYPTERPAAILSQVTRPGSSVMDLQISCLTARAFVAALKFAWLALERAFAKRPPITLEHPSARSLVAQLRFDAPAGFNSKFILLEANNRQIPWIRIWRNIFQLGYGRHARLFDSSLSDATSKIGSALAGNKSATSTFLTNAGFPVVPSAVVASAEEALEQAKKIGLPVVVKPVSTEGGAGVFALLQDDAEIINAFNAAQKLSKQVLVERFFEGKDYRVHVVNNVVHGVVERQPASVVGDGKSTIDQLIKIVNRERKHATDDRQYLHAIQANEETQRVCALQRYVLSDIPPVGEFVRLSAICNVTTGGQPQEHSPDVMHADNKQLCIDAARQLRLDIAGVDLLIPDISVSWRESGAHICEINHKPQMFTSFFPALLESFFTGHGGKIPISLVLESGPDMPVSSALVTRLQGTHSSVCWVRNASQQGTNTTSPQRESVLHRAKQALLNVGTDALVVTLSGDLNINSGWPFNYCDELVLVPTEERSIERIEASGLYQEIIRTLKPERVTISGG